jgi:UDP-N-acetylglucosamine 3-dehydrogenase
MLRVGVIGAGKMGTNHLKVWSETPDVELVAVADSIKEVARLAGEQFNIKYFTDYHEMPKLDAVSIVVPTNLHYEVGKYFLESGIPCLMEKPLADTSVHAGELVSIVEKTSTMMMVGHIERFNISYQTLRQKVIDQSALGDPKIFMARRAMTMPMRPQVVETGIVLEAMIHDIDLATDVMGDPANIDAAMNRQETYAVGVFKYFNDAISILEADWVSHKERTLIVIGEKGAARADLLHKSLSIMTDFDREEETTFKLEDKSSALHREIQHFVDCIIHDKPPLVDAKAGKKVVDIAEKLKFASKITPRQGEACRDDA